jgi:hypothetical protein
MEPASPNPPHELLLPSDRFATYFSSTLIAIVTSATLLALYDIILGIAYIAPALWLLLTICITRIAIREARGVRPWLINLLGSMTNRHFLCIESLESEPAITLGFYWRRARFIQKKIPLASLASVEWSPGQNPEYWNVFINSHHVGASLPQPQIHSLGASIVELLNANGALLVHEEHPRGVSYRAPAHPAPSPSPLPRIPSPHTPEA